MVDTKVPTIVFVLGELNYQVQHMKKTKQFVVAPREFSILFHVEKHYDSNKKERAYYRYFNGIAVRYPIQPIFGGHPKTTRMLPMRWTSQFSRISSDTPMSQI